MRECQKVRILQFQSDDGRLMFEDAQIPQALLLEEEERHLLVTVPFGHPEEREDTKDRQRELDRDRRCCQ